MDSDLFLKYCGLRPCYMSKEYMNIVKNKGFKNFNNYYNILDKIYLTNNDKENKSDILVKKPFSIKKTEYIYNFVKNYMPVYILEDTIEDYTSDEYSSDDIGLIDEYISD